jgi:hypothetical protein
MEGERRDGGPSPVGSFSVVSENESCCGGVRCRRHSCHRPYPAGCGVWGYAGGLRDLPARLAHFERYVADGDGT